MSLRLAAWVLLLTAALSACRPQATPTPPVEQIVTLTAARMTSLSGFHFVIERSGAPAYLDYEQTLAFRRAEGDFVAPDRARATVRVIAPGLVLDVGILSLGERYWQTNLLNGAWEEFPPGVGFNPATLFDPQNGLQPLMQSDLVDLQLDGIEELDDLPGQKLYALHGQLAGERLFQMSYEMIGPETIEVHLWVDPKTYDLYRVRLTEPALDNEATVWQMDFWNFGKVTEIVPPALATP